MGYFCLCLKIRQDRKLNARSQWNRQTASNRCVCVCVRCIIQFEDDMLHGSQIPPRDLLSLPWTRLHINNRFTCVNCNIRSRGSSLMTGGPLENNASSHGNSRLLPMKPNYNTQHPNPHTHTHCRPSTWRGRTLADEETSIRGDIYRGSTHR